MPPVTAQRPIDYVMPDIGLSHAVAGVRVTGGLIRWAGGAAMFHPGVAALVLGLITRALHGLAAASAEASFVPAPVKDAAGNMILNPAPSPAQLAAPAKVAGMWNYAATLTMLAALFFGIGAVTLYVISLFEQPTHRQVAGGWAPVKGHVSLSAQRRGGYVRIPPVKERFTAEERRARRQIAQTQTWLTRIGQARLHTWGRRWAAEDAARAQRTQPGIVDRWLIRQTPKPKATKAAKTKKPKVKPATKMEAAQIDAEVERIRNLPDPPAAQADVLDVEEVA